MPEFLEPQFFAPRRQLAACPIFFPPIAILVGMLVVVIHAFTLPHEFLRLWRTNVSDRPAA